MTRGQAHASGVGEAQLVMLPGGYVDGAGRTHTEAALVPLAGTAEETVGSWAGASVASLTTALLACTVVRIGTIDRVTPQLVRALLVQDRDYLLVRLRALSVGRSMWVRLVCPGCAEDMELELALDQLPVVRRPVRKRYVAFDAGLELRLPTGGDQEWAADAGPADPAELRRRLAARCVRRRGARASARRLDDAVVDRVERRMSELAPDVTPEADAVCPHCGAAFSGQIDLPYLVLAELASVTRRLEEDVHLLAWHYHWSERDILRLPRPKREAYLKLIRAQLDANAGAWS
jgi:hypothetical protein